MRPVAYYHPHGLANPKRVPVEILGAVGQHLRVRLLEEATLPTQGPGRPNKPGTVVFAPKCSVEPPTATLEEQGQIIRRLYRDALNRGYRDGVRDTRQRYADPTWRGRIGGLRFAARVALDAGYPEAAKAIYQHLPKPKEAAE